MYEGYAIPTLGSSKEIRVPDLRMVMSTCQSNRDVVTIQQRNRHGAKTGVAHAVAEPLLFRYRPVNLYNTRRQGRKEAMSRIVFVCWTQRTKDPRKSKIRKNKNEKDKAGNNKTVARVDRPQILLLIFTNSKSRVNAILNSMMGR